MNDALPCNHMQSEQRYKVTTKSSAPDLCSAHTPASALSINSLIFMLCLCSWFTNKGNLGPPVTICSGIAQLYGCWFWFLLFGGRLWKPASHASPVLGPDANESSALPSSFCLCFVSELIHLAPLLPLFLLFTPTSLNLSPSSSQTNYAIDRLGRFLGQMLKYILLCI